MGLSSKQVSNDVQPWNNHHHHPLPQSMNCTEEAAIGSTVLKEPPKQLPVKRKVVDHHHGDGDKCPRCGSGNTKFCYYNNYNKTQPRHFCKECKRHWTKGGTLRNVPVGGGRKHKRIKISSSSSNTASTKSIGLVGITDKKSNLTHSSSSSIVKPQQQYSLSPQFSHIFDSSTTTVNDNTNDLFMGKISAASPSTDHRHHMVEINHLLDFSGSSTTTLPYQSFSTTPSTLDESLSIFNSSDYNSSFQTSTYGYTSDQSTSLELEVDGTLTFGTGGGTNSMNYDQSWKSNNLQLGWDEIDKFVSSDEIDVSWDIDSEINYG